MLPCPCVYPKDPISPSDHDNLEQAKIAQGRIFVTNSSRALLEKSNVRLDVYKRIQSCPGSQKRRRTALSPDCQQPPESHRESVLRIKIKIQVPAHQPHPATPKQLGMTHHGENCARHNRGKRGAFPIAFRSGSVTSAILRSTEITHLYSAGLYCSTRLSTDQQPTLQHSLRSGSCRCEPTYLGLPAILLVQTYQNITPENFRMIFTLRDCIMHSSSWKEP
jgi:hypothetical protein